MTPAVLGHKFSRLGRGSVRYGPLFVAEVSVFWLILMGVDLSGYGTTSSSSYLPEWYPLIALLLVRVPVEDRGPGVDAPKPLDRAGVEEHRLREARLAGATVGDERDVPNLVGRGGLHRGLRLLAQAQRRRGDSLRRTV